MLELYVFSFIVIIFLDGVYPSLTIYFFGREKLARYYYLLPNTYYLLPNTYYLNLPLTYYLLPITSYLLPLTYYLLPITSYLIPITSSLISSSSPRNIKQKPCRKRTFC
jgi:hypothetical protein